MSDLDQFTRDDIVRAIRKIEGGHAIPVQMRASGYDVLFEGTSYPPKYLFRLAAKLTGKALGGFSGGPPTNDALRRLGFTVVARATMRPEDFDAAWNKLEGSAEMSALLEQMKKFNYFRALGIERAEVRHSAFLGFLFDPKGGHELGDLPARCLLGAMRSRNKAAGKSSLVKDGELDLMDLSVRLEFTLPDKRRIDLLLKSERQKLAVLIENKIDSKEHNEQLQRYADWAEKEFAQDARDLYYLTVEGDQARDPRWTETDYGCIRDGVKRILEERPQANADVRALLQHYISYLESDLLRDGIIAVLCRKIWKQHREVLNQLYRYRGDDLAQADEAIPAEDAD